MPDPPVTLRDVAVRAGVHPATASRALNPETRILVSEDTAQRALDAAAALGYRPNPVARSLRTRRSHTVGGLIPDLNTPLCPPIVRGLEDRLAAAGYVALLGNTDSDDERERMVFEQMRARHVDGLVLATARLRHPLLAQAARSEMPVALINRLAQGYSFPSVTVADHHQVPALPGRHRSGPAAAGADSRARRPGEDPLPRPRARHPRVHGAGPGLVQFAELAPRRGVEGGCPPWGWAARLLSRG